MAFKGEISVARLNSVKTGFTIGDTYRIIDGGKLGGVAIPFGTFVEWKGTYWAVQPSLQLATTKDATAAADKATSFALAGDADDVLAVSVTAEVYATYDVGYYYSFNGTVCKCTDKTTEDDKYIVELTQVGVANALNQIIDAMGE